MRLLWLCLPTQLCLPPAAQATMYKCTQPDGKSTFQDTPCPGGTVGTVANVTSVQTVSQSPIDTNIGSPVPVAVGGGVYSSGADPTYVPQPGVAVWRDRRAIEHREAEIRRREEAVRHAEQQRSSPLPASSGNTSRASASRAPAAHAAAHAAAHGTAR